MQAGIFRDTTKDLASNNTGCVNQQHDRWIHIHNHNIMSIAYASIVVRYDNSFVIYDIGLEGVIV